MTVMDFKHSRVENKLPLTEKFRGKGTAMEPPVFTST